MLLSFRISLHLAYQYVFHFKLLVLFMYKRGRLDIPNGRRSDSPVVRRVIGPKSGPLVRMVCSPTVH